MEPSDCQGNLLKTGLEQGKQRGGPRWPDAVQRNTSPRPGVHRLWVAMQSPLQSGRVTWGAVEGSQQAALLRTASPEADPDAKNPH